MKIFDIIRMAFRNLFRSKVRTILTVLGIIIGTTAIIIMLSLGIAMNVSYREQMSRMGSLNVINVYPNYDNIQTGRRGRNDVWVEPTISQEELDKIKQIPNVEAVTPFYQTSVKMEIGKYLGYVTIVGIEPDAMASLEYKAAEGRLLNPDDKMQIVFGSNMKDQFYNPKEMRRGRMYFGWGGSGEEKDINFLEDRINMTFDMSYGDRYPGSQTGKKPKLYRVEGVGILEEGNWETAYQAYMNIHELVKLDQEYKQQQANPDQKNRKRKTEEVGFQQAKVKVNEIKNVLEVQEQIRAIGLNAWSMAESLEAANKTQGVMQGVLGGIGAISLLVAAIGIANTMIMAIYERTKEIGIMKVIGARIKDIRRLFLYEASMIGFIGGVLGIAFSFGISYLLNTVGVRFLGGMGMGMPDAKLSIIPVWLVLMGMVFSALIGLISGFFPARKATKLSALSAIHTE
ncbi:MAG: ABC transporter permease [Clostridiaceae bacterium]|nr:ABC transporter permease [Clostridiaceae bacterium]